MDDPEPKREGGRAARRASDTHQRLLQAALSVFNELGFDGCAIEDITERADVGKGTFYRHFHDKVAILTSLIEQAVSFIENRIAIPSPTPSMLEHSVSTVVRAHLAMFKEHRELFLIFLQAHSMMAVRKESLPYLQTPFTQYWTLLEAQLSGAAASHTPSANPRFLASAVSGSIFGIVMANLAAMSEEVNNDQMDALCNALVAGIVQHLR